MPQINGQEVGPIGYGLMGLTWRATPPPQEEAFGAMRAALANGCNFWNGGEFYGPPDANSMILLEKYFSKYPEDADKVVLSIKGAAGPNGGMPDSSEKEIRRTLDNTIKQLNGRKKLDIFECARRDKTTPMEETFGVMKEYIDKGLLGGISLSEVAAQTIHDAVKITKIVAVEVELSLFSTDVLTNGVAEACYQYNIPLVAYSPLGRGFLTGQIKKREDIPENSMLRHFPRYSEENFGENIKLVHQVEELAQKKGCTTGQLAIGWVRALSRRPGMPTIIPIPGATKAGRVDENSKLIELTDAEMESLDTTLSKFTPKGERYPSHVPTNT